MPYNFVADS